MFYVNRKNNKRYNYIGAGVSSFCNGLAFEFKEMGKWNGTSSLYDNPSFGADIQTVRRMVVQGMAERGVVITDAASGKLLDLMSGEWSRNHHVFRVDVNEQPMYYVGIRKTRVKSPTLKGMLDCFSRQYAFENYLYAKKKNKGLVLTPDQKRFLANTAKPITEEQILEYTKDMLEYMETFDGRDTVNMRNVLPNAWCKPGAGAEAKVMEGYIAQQQPGSISRLAVMTGPHLTRNTTASVKSPVSSGSFDGHPFNNPIYACPDEDSAWRLFYSSMYVRMFRDYKSYDTYFITDNFNAATYGMKPSSIIKNIVERELAGNVAVETYGGNILYHAVVPMAVGNRNHGDHPTGIVFFSKYPISVTDITKKPRAPRK